MGIEVAKIFKSDTPRDYREAVNNLLGKKVQVHKKGCQDPERTIEVRTVGAPPSRTAINAGVVCTLGNSGQIIVITSEDNVTIIN